MSCFFSLLVGSTSKGVWQISHLGLISPDPCATFEGPLLHSQSSVHSAVSIDFNHTLTIPLIPWSATSVHKSKNLSKAGLFSWESRALPWVLLAFQVQAFWAQTGNNKSLLVIASVITRRASGRAPESWPSFLKNKHSRSKILIRPSESLAWIVPIVGPGSRSLSLFCNDWVCIYRGKINTCMENKEPLIWLQWFWDSSQDQ